MTIQEVIDEYGSEILGLGLGRRSLAAWLTENLDGNFTEHFARQVLRELDKVTEPPEPIQENEARSIEQALRESYGIYDESWQPTKVWGPPNAPNAKWERVGTAFDPKRAKEIIDTLGDGSSLPQTVYRPASERMGVLSIRDTHFGMATDFPEPYAKYDLAEAQEAYIEASGCLMRLLAHNGVDSLAFPVMSDGIHVDGPANATTKGTRQDVSAPWWQAYEVYLESVNEVVYRAKEMFDSVTVVMEGGNHDENQARSMGIALKSKWNRDGDVEVMAGPETLKMVAVGGSRVFFNHGNSLRGEAIPTVIMNDYRDQIYGAKYIEVLSGHVHHRKRGVLREAGDYLEDGGIVQRVTPCFCPPTAYSESHGYRSKVGAQATWYDNDGFVGLGEWRP